MAQRYTGWLLRTNRRFGGDRALRSGRDFAAAFRSNAGAPLAPSQVTRWECGDLLPSTPTILRYEQLLALPPRHLLVSIETLLRAEDLKTPGRPASGPEHDDPTLRRLHGLLDRAAGSSTMTGTGMTGAEWGELADTVSRLPWLVLHPAGLWQTITDRLLAELVVASGVAWFQRQEAISRLLEHPVASPHAVASCVALCEDSLSPAVIEPLSLLEVTSHRDANRYVLDQLERPNDDRSFIGAMLAAERKIRKRHFGPGTPQRLVNVVAAALKDSTTNPHLRPLVVDIGRALTDVAPGSRAILRAVVPGRTVTPRPGTARGEAESIRDTVASRICLVAQAAVGDEAAGVDDILLGLVRQSMFDDNLDRRLLAATLIAATPYRLPVAEAMVVEVSADVGRRTRILPDYPLRTLTDLDVDLHRPLLRTILSSGSPGDVTRQAAWATPHCPGQFSEIEWRRILGVHRARWARSRSELTGSILHGVTYGIGTDQHRSLLTEIRTDHQMPPPARTTADWLLHTSLVHS
jgi:hypothetical protein